MTDAAAGLILAAGKSERYGSIKALSRWGGRSAIECAVRTLQDGGCAPIWTVLAPPHAPAIVRELRGSEVVHCGAPTVDMMDSLRAGLTQILETRAPAVVVSLVDHPEVRAETVRLLIHAWRSKGANVVTPQHEGRGGHPYLVSRAAAERLLAAPQGATPRQILRAVTLRYYLCVDDAAILQDTDAPDSRLAHPRRGHQDTETVNR